jgi:hypothetical protein
MKLARITRNTRDGGTGSGSDAPTRRHPAGQPPGLRGHLTLSAHHGCHPGIFIRPAARGGSAGTITRPGAPAAELNSRGRTASAQAPPGGPPGLHAPNPEPCAAALPDSIPARPQTDGRRPNWRPLAEPVAGTAAAAAAIIVRALRPAEA